jgi:uncharacterized protein (TIGR02147 family)
MVGLLSNYRPDHVHVDTVDAIEPDIFNFLDFRGFLKAAYEFRHSLNRKYTKSTVCNEMGMPNTRSYFNAVLKGGNVSKAKTEDFIRVFGLGKEEAKYFRIMVKYQQAMASSEEREWYLRLLMAQYRPPETCPNTPPEVLAI